MSRRMKGRSRSPCLGESTDPRRRKGVKMMIPIRAGVEQWRRCRVEKVSKEG